MKINLQLALLDAVPLFTGTVITKADAASTYLTNIGFYYNSSFITKIISLAVKLMQYMGE